MDDPWAHVGTIVAMDFLHEVETHRLQDWEQLINRSVLLQVGLENIHGALRDRMMTVRAARGPFGGPNAAGLEKIYLAEQTDVVRAATSLSTLLLPSLEGLTSLVYRQSSARLEAGRSCQDKQTQKSHRH